MRRDINYVKFVQKLVTFNIWQSCASIYIYMFHMLKIAKVEESSDFRENTEKKALRHLII